MAPYFTNEPDDIESVEVIPEVEPDDAEPVQADPTPEVDPPQVFAEIPPAHITPGPTLIKHSLSGDKWRFELPSSEVQLRIQEDLQHRGFYSGKTNGNWGNLSVQAIGAVVGHHGQTVDSDLINKIQNFAVEHGGLTTETITLGHLTDEIWDAFAVALEKDVQ